MSAGEASSKEPEFLDVEDVIETEVDPDAALEEPVRYA